MRVLVGCEESQAVCIEFRKLGHEAYSCDILPCSGGHPEWHLQGDLIKTIERFHWDLIIAHPPCTYLSRAGARWLHEKGTINQTRYAKGLLAKSFFMWIYDHHCDKIAIENPVPLRIFNLPKHTCVIQPYEFGHPFSKRTNLWLKGLPCLFPTDIRTEYVPFLPSNTGGKKRGQKATYKSISQKYSSKTFPGIAKAMAEQWGGNINRGEEGK